MICLQAEKYVQFDHCFTDEEKSSANALRLSCYLNDAACKLRLGDYSGATKFCTKVSLSLSLAQLLRMNRAVALLR